MKRALFASTILTALSSLPAIAFAQGIPQIDLSAGYMATTDRHAAGSGILTLRDVGVHVPGLHPQASLAVPFSGDGRYAATAEEVLHVPGGAYIGAGAGLGRLNQPLQTGMLYDVIGGTPLAPHIDLVGRYYGGLNHYTGQGLYGGLAIRL
ncbi:MAG: hypothetical protein JWN27_1154 [Candidatus Eremiobacteraeota bacterium]|nr:hypothetical protein [Candidatus Eremiobacteraeota bacterium]